MGSSWEVRDQNSINGVDECLMSGRVYYFFIMNEFESQITVLSNLIARICIILPFRFITPIGCSTQHCSQLATCLWFEAQTKAVWMQFQSFRCLASRRMLSKCSRHQQGQKYENIWKMKKTNIWYVYIQDNISKHHCLEYDTNVLSHRKWCQPDLLLVIFTWLASNYAPFVQTLRWKLCSLDSSSFFWRLDIQHCLGFFLQNLASKPSFLSKNNLTRNLEISVVSWEKPRPKKKEENGSKSQGRTNQWLLGSWVDHPCWVGDPETWRQKGWKQVT